MAGSGVALAVGVPMLLYIIWKIAQCIGMGDSVVTVIVWLASLIGIERTEWNMMLFVGAAVGTVLLLMLLFG
jgi:hypothetical protein